ncbi:ComEC/Rec2 family competence protein [Fluviicola taffensis]|uniref:ComEC/Rec2-related protein n=1 Tax=Fluviicola taffensis (strain DSM 16823 / NCIMB 13979 / RW262) TaxID=755732 RepID=F2IDC7_FLUTR|nr:ComEC/Rec2 family competence protein [Fluviicola taffensis]AEA42303.1 ComEC/Rec2-related protein [Fluviicola taffensis DSM 16823]
MPLLPLLIGLVIGIFCPVVFNDSPKIVVLSITSGLSATCLSLFFASLFQKNSMKRKLTPLAFGFASMLVGVLLIELSKQETSQLETLSNKINIGTVFRTKISESGYQTIHVSLEKQQSGDYFQSVNGSVILTLDTLEGKFTIGDIIAFKTTLEAFKNETNPGSFDAEYYYGTHHYVGRAFISSNLISKIGTGESISLFFSKRQNEIAEKLKSWLPESVSGIGIALLVGAKTDINQEVLDSFSNTGAMHVLAVSGLHVGIILIIFQAILQLFSRWISKKQSIILSVVLIWSFGLLSGASPSVIRAVVMFSILVLGQLLNRKNSGLNNLIFSAILLLMYDPYYLFDIGFQLSYVALVGIFLFQTPIYKLIYVSNKPLDWIWKGSAVGIAATITTTPFMLYWFHQFPNYFLLSNIVVMLLGFVVLLLPIILMATAWIPYFKTLIIFLTALSLQLLILGIQWVNDIPGGVSAGFELSFVEFLVTASLIGFCAHQFLVRKLIPKGAFLALALCFFLISWKREEKFNQNNLYLFSSKHFCGMIQWNGQIITFSEIPEGNKSIEQTLKNAVRFSGLNLTKPIILQSSNKLIIGKKNLLINQTKNGWEIHVDTLKIQYRTKGTPNSFENKQLMSVKLQRYLYGNETIQPFKISI